MYLAEQQATHEAPDLPLCRWSDALICRLFLWKDSFALYGSWDDWAYFLAHEPDGRLQVANISHTRIDSWDQVESIEKRKPVTVRALTEKTSAVSQHGRRSARCLAPEYVIAEVLMGRKNLCGYTDSFHPRYAGGKEFGSASGAIIHHDDMCQMRATANRGVMPVCKSKR